MSAASHHVATAAPAQQPERASRPGTPLAGGVRDRMEAIVGGDLSGVALHTDALAADRARKQGTLALTEGADVDFAAGAYRPGTVAGEALLAHELAHVRQQQGGTGVGVASGLEAEADRAGLAAVLRFYEPRSARAAATPRITRGHGLRLQRCSAAEYPEIGDLPTRAEYEQRGELEPLVPDTLVPMFSGVDLGGGAGGTTAEATPAEPLPEIDPPAPELDQEQLLARLAVIQQRQERIDALTADVARGTGLPSEFTYASIRHDIVEPDPEGTPGLTVPAGIPGLKPVAFGPWTAASLSRALPRAEEVQRRAEDALVELAGVRANEEAAHGQMVDRGYDLDAAYAAIDEVRGAYAQTSAEVLGPNVVARLAAADEARRRLDLTLVRLLLDYHENRSAPGSDIAPVVSDMQDWARILGATLARLGTEADDIRASRERGEPGVRLRVRLFARDAQLVATSLDALAEWDVALTAYETLSESSALWGEDAVYRIGGRLNQMKEASLAGDEAYLRLMVRDHRADPDVVAFYADLPEIIETSHMIIGFAILLVTAAVTAGVGVVISGAASGVALSVEASALASGASATAAAAEASIVLQLGLVAKIGGEALVFTYVHRQLSAAIPGMEPKSSFLYDFCWNLALFGAMAGTGKLVEGALARPAIKALGPSIKAIATTGARLGGSYATLQAYGMVRFVYEQQRMMTLAELGKMSADNLVMLAGLSIAMSPLGSALKSLESRAGREGARATRTLIDFRARWGRDFARLDAERAEIQQELADVVEENPDATEADVAGIQARALALDAELRLIVDDAVARTDVDALRKDMLQVTVEIQATPIPELFADLGLDPVADLRATGDPTLWTFAPGRSDGVTSFLADAGLPASADNVAGQRMYAVSVAGLGEITLVERTGEEFDVTPPGWPLAPSILDPLGAKGGYVPAGIEAVKRQMVVPGLLARLEALVDGGKAAQAQTLLKVAGRLANERGEVAAEEPAVPLTPEEAAELAQERFNIERNHMEAISLALSDRDAYLGLTRLGTNLRDPGPSKVLAAAEPEDLAPFLSAVSKDGMGKSGRGAAEFYQSLARSRPACDLVNKYGNVIFWRVANLHGHRLPEGLKVTRARLDFERTFAGLEAGRITLKELLKQLEDGATIGTLDALVGPRPPAGPALERVKGREWDALREKAKAFAAAHPQKPGEAPATPGEIDTQATLLQTVERARRREFADYTPAQRAKLLIEFNAQAEGARLLKQWIDTTRGYLNEALALGSGAASIRTMWVRGRVVTTAKKGEATIPDEAWPPVTEEDMGLDPEAKALDPESTWRKVERMARRWIERKSYNLGGAVDREGVSIRAKDAAADHAREAREDLTNLPPGSTIELEYDRMPKPLTRQEMLRILFTEPGIERVTFQGITYTRAGLVK